MNGEEFRVVWRFRIKSGGPQDVLPQRTKVYKTRVGADRLIAKLQSNGGNYQKMDDSLPGWGGDDGLTVTDLMLDFARIETRWVGEWQVAEVLR